MPNWCNNSITITGPADQMKTIWEQAQSNWKTENYGLLNVMVPIPEALKGTRSPSPDDGSQPIVDGYDNWYDWCVNNWGTKWDINDEGLVFEDTEDGYATISGWFESAWAPPITAYDKFMENNPEIQIYSIYEEGGMDFAGIYDNGDDEFMDDLSVACEEVVRGEVPLEEQTELFQRLDEELDLVENRREYIEEQMEEEEMQGQIADHMLANQEVAMTDKLIDAVLEQIKSDVESRDMTAIEELVSTLPVDRLRGYLPEDQWAEHKEPNDA